MRIKKLNKIDGALKSLFENHKMCITLMITSLATTLFAVRKEKKKSRKSSEIKKPHSFVDVQMITLNNKVKRKNINNNDISKTTLNKQLLKTC
ncbi:unnamed protein product [Nezara viridula]|uniref:Uncharacterized protein n=1 Tax=Nezara viridula TaxID=85310 RepID=A0A9P0MXG3_NEZVI|nr:unnamed protein product [Nezara viridula]